MKQSAKITLSAISAALAAVIMLVSFFPYFTYAVPAVAGLVMMMPLIEIGTSWAFSAYIVSAVLSLLIAEKEAAVLYVCLLGFYPILKSVIERLKNGLLEWIIKLAVFNIAVCAAYFVLSAVIGLSAEDFGILGKYGVYILLALGNIVFVIYDIAISRFSIVYFIKIHPQIKKMFKNR
jgi:hypothetical protein